MDGQQLLEVLLVLPDQVERRELLAAQIPNLSPKQQDRLAEALKAQADQLIQSEISRCLEFADLIHELADLSGIQRYRALGLLAQANAYVIGLGEYQKGMALYDEAAAIYGELDCPEKQAQSQTGKLWALANLGRYEEALATGEWVAEVLEEHGAWLALAKLTSNVAIILGRLGRESEALDSLDMARNSYRKLGSEGEINLLRVEINRAITLRNLGRFDESIATNKSVLESYGRLGFDQSIAVARAQQNLGITYFVLGRYNEALALLDKAQETFAADGRQRHAMLVELFVSDCLLQLRRFPETLEKCAQVRAHFGEIGAQLEVAHAMLNEASAYSSLQRHDDALVSLAEARRIFKAEGNRVAVADSDLQTAEVLRSLGQFERSLELARASAALFAENNLPIGQARAHLVAARAAIPNGCFDEAKEHVELALAIGEAHNTPALTYMGHYLRGTLAHYRGDDRDALAAYDRAIQELEQLYSRLMIEYRANFAEDKGGLYEDTVALCLDLDAPDLGLAYSERAKSRALQDLVGHRIDLRIEARSDEDRPMVEELLELRSERDRLYRRWETGERVAQRGHMDELEPERQGVEQRVLALEKRITELWHTLLIRNADYARDASLWQVRVEPIQPYLDEGTALLEYFSVNGRFVVFLVSASDLKAFRLPGRVEESQALLQHLWHNLKTVPRTAPARVPSLMTNVRGLSQKLYRLLLEPLAGELERFRGVIVVPHGSLHYLPFHALHDGQGYLLERHEFSYLPGASLLRYCREADTAGDGFLAIGHSQNGRLPNAVREAQDIAGLWSGEVALEEKATVGRFLAAAHETHILHLATHGDFRPDNPLFSGLALDDGWLTTLDVFNMRLRASLVTLSACQTGRSVVAGGNELLGLMRAFLGAGTASLLSTLWAVDDSSTSLLMRDFYERLAAGSTKGEALRQSQLAFIGQQPEYGKYEHPYFWAPFYLVGDAGEI